MIFLVIIFIIAIAFYIYYLSRGKCSEPAPSEQPPTANQPRHFDIIEFNIAGMSYRDNIDNYLGEFKGTLKAEPTNEYDPNAIKILAHDGHHIGYVPRDTTDAIRNAIHLPCHCFCYIGNNNGTYFSDCYITTN